MKKQTQYAEQWEHYANEQYEDLIRLFSYWFDYNTGNKNLKTTTERMFHWKAWVKWEASRSYNQVITDHKLSLLFIKMGTSYLTTPREKK